MAPNDAALDAFAAQVNRPEAQIDLARASLLLGAFEYADLDVAAYVQRIDRLAESAALLLPTADLPPLALSQYLFRTLGFAGNHQDYLDPRNSFLNQVLERRLGIPITLSVLYMEVARRLGIAAAGVGLPGHFIVRVAPPAPAEPFFLDPFNQGALMDGDDCRDRVRVLTGGQLPFTEDFLKPVGPRYILLRILNNLKNAYASRKDLERALRVVERLLVLKPSDPEEIRNLGLLHAGLGHLRQAISLLEHYLELRPDAPDTATVRGYMATMGSNLARWN